MEEETLPPGQFIKLGAEPAFKVLEDHGHKRDISNLVAHKGVAHEFRAQGPQVHHARAAYERSYKADHEINRMIRGQNTEVAHARPERIPGCQRLALLEIILMREHASLGTPTRPRRINYAGHILALSW